MVEVDAVRTVERVKTMHNSCVLGVTDGIVGYNGCCRSMGVI
jgi:hypothetical protein